MNSFLAPSNQDFEGQTSSSAACTICVTRRNQDLEIKLNVGDRTVSQMLISSNVAYLLSEKDVTDGGYSFSLTSSDGRQSLSLTHAEDAFENVTLLENGTPIECEMDM
jgi:hypothetical protein